MTETPSRLGHAARYDLWPVDRALATVIAHSHPLGTERIAIEAAYGRVLAETVRAPADLPPHPQSTVDGFAVVADDGAARLRVLEEITAGQASDVRVEPGTASRIMTGAPLPPGADAVVMIEHTRQTDGWVELERRPKLGDNVQRVGLVMTAGQVVLEPGYPLGAPEVGLLAMVGRAEVEVYRRPVVAVLSTGDELVEPTVEPARGQVRDSNRPALLMAVREAGGEPISLGRARDDEALQRRLITEGLERADVLITSGGVSMGSRDLIKPILESLGTVHFGRIKLKPGKPLTFATVGTKLAFGLPGFPVSSLVTFEVFVRPALRRLQGFRRYLRPEVEAVLEHDTRQTPDRTEYQRAVTRWADGRLVTSTTGVQASSRLLSLLGANSLIVIAPGEGVIPAGSTVRVLLTGELEGDADALSHRL